MSTESWEPNGVRFQDLRGRELLLVNEPGHWANGWICYRHPDGQWVTLRMATCDDRAAVETSQLRERNMDELRKRLPPLPGAHA